MAGVSVPGVPGGVPGGISLLPPAGGMPRRPVGWVMPGAGAALLSVLMLQVVAELARYGAEGDDALSVVLGLAAVAVTLLPIMVVLLHRTVRGWRGASARGETSGT
ncbi:hypothetical protein M2352_002443 [Azospirillum fermentarium]|uniref:hypothetical protein n=1 Tax=Azospirillum fermentarium TaxID=1233114 RepID=UPI00222642DF|nr:hypothetical protein [Azospirillum fermentarium]MCW2246852.1 hypothetical protein [Azospirillum fermentarium]